MNYRNLSDEALLADLGQRLRQRRLAANLTQETLARDSGVALNTVRNAEDGRNVSLETLIRMLRVLGGLGQLERLLGDTGPSPIELAKRQGKPRERASGVHDDDDGDWQW